MNIHCICLDFKTARMGHIEHNVLAGQFVNDKSSGCRYRFVEIEVNGLIIWEHSEINRRCIRGDIHDAFCGILQIVRRSRADAHEVINVALDLRRALVIVMDITVYAVKNAEDPLSLSRHDIDVYRCS